MARYAESTVCMPCASTESATALVVVAYVTNCGVAGSTCTPGPTPSCAAASAASPVGPDDVELTTMTCDVVTYQGGMALEMAAATTPAANPRIALPGNLRIRISSCSTSSIWCRV